MTARRDLRIFVYQLSYADPFPFETHIGRAGGSQGERALDQPAQRAVPHPRRCLGATARSSRRSAIASGTARTARS